MNCYCNESFDYRCLCAPWENSFRFCPMRHEYIAEVICRNNYETYKLIESGATPKEAVAVAFAKDGLNLDLQRICWETIDYLLEESSDDDDESVLEDSCDCCVKGFTNENEFGRCECWCPYHMELYRECHSDDCHTRPEKVQSEKKIEQDYL